MFISRKSTGYVFPLVSDIWGVERLRRGFHYSLHGTSRLAANGRSAEGAFTTRKKLVCWPKVSQNQKTWALLQILQLCKMLDNMSPRLRLACRLHYHNRRAFTLALAACGKCSPSLPSVGPTNDLFRPHTQFSKCVIS